MNLIRHFGLDRSVVGGDGARIQLEDGTTAIDVVAGFGAMPLGVSPELPSGSATSPAFGRPFDCPPETRRLTQTLRGLYDDLGPRRAGGVLYCLSGTQAVQVADQVACIATGKDVVVGLRDGFHGRLGVAGALSSQAARPPFYASAAGRTARLLAPGEELSRVESAMSDGQVSALFLELVQGEAGGMRVLEGPWVVQLLALARSYGVVTVIDEIQTGLGRTGSILAAGGYGVQPDILLLGKALGGGLHPISAVIIADQYWDDWFRMTISSTFDTPRHAAATASAFLDLVVRPSFLAEIRQRGQRLQAGLDRVAADHPAVYRGRRGIALMQSLELRLADGSQLATFAERKGIGVLALCSWLLKHGVRASPCTGVPRRLRLTPPLTIRTEEIDVVVAALDEFARFLARPGSLARLLAGVRDVHPLLKTA